MMLLQLLLIATVARAASVNDDPLRPSVQSTESGESSVRAIEDRHVFSPRMDYEEWKPLGRGDPLKNDPTYDYVPPVLERVHYWVDPSKRTPDPPLPKSDVVTSDPMDTSTTYISATSRLGTMNLLDPFFKLMDASKATLGFSTLSSNYFRPTLSPQYKFPPQEISSYYGQPKIPNSFGYGVPNAPLKLQALQRPPYTMLMPPPPPLVPSTSTETMVTSFGTSTRTTSETEEVFPTIAATVVATSETNDDIGASTTGTTLKPDAATPTTILANSENLYKPVAITMPESISNETNDATITTPTPHLKQQDSMHVPMVSKFTDHSNHLHYQDTKFPFDIMVPPPRNNDDYDYFLPTTIRTTTVAITTDPIFKHYKQPSEPVGGPFYLIIQGHSKVKTYGASKNKINAVSSNEINYEDGKSKGYDSFDLDDNRRERKLHYENSNYISDHVNADIVKGHPTIELIASFDAKETSKFSVSDNATLNDLEKVFPESSDQKSEEKILITGNSSTTNHRRKRFIGRRLLGKLSSADKDSEATLDQQQLGLESLIALNEDYNSEDVINLLLKEEGQGSGFGGLVASLLSKSLKSKEDI